MTVAAPRTGNSSTIVFGTSAFAAHFSLIGPNKQDRPVLETTHLGTGAFDTTIPGDTAKPGQLEIEYYYDPDANPPFAAAETITLTFPLPAGKSVAATLAGTGYIVSRSTPQLKNNEVMMGKATIQWDGGTGPTFTASSS